MYEFRVSIAEELGMGLNVHVNQEGVEQGVCPFTHGSKVHTGIIKTQAFKAGAESVQF
ncbi:MULTISPECIES: phosphoadenosine phosphosulfate reductase family protein [unclassified Wenzhouxiangella]|uniref:phosphoadenosine phosphosulfate reductase family protein n=1 Tax=unclassified Wenzhouxiangella TaxID=2613841 RepID=UPI0021624D9D|nr:MULTISPECIES: phosphoadenosine phosphosulfate reductase family protein [unclassified Wenzhouxiangella]